IRRARLDRLWNRLVSDLTDACHIHVRCEERVLAGKRLKGTHRVLSTADRSATWIAKGDRVPTVGYKPQLARSRNGLVTAMLVPEGNATDSAMCLPLTNAAAVNTGVVPALASFDDGYASADNLARLEDLGIRDVSFSGAKGKRLLGEELYDGETMRDARRNRSAVESLMFCLKHGHEFGQLRRRGIDAVRAELTGKTVVYNFCRIIMLRRNGKATAEPDAKAA
ncbi:MAG: transposase, partial [Victivallales bacterium]|nr:transposase [Victivallales bacterium]